MHASPHFAAVNTYYKDFKTLDEIVVSFLKILLIYHLLLASKVIDAKIPCLSLDTINQILDVYFYLCNTCSFFSPTVQLSLLKPAARQFFFAQLFLRVFTSLMSSFKQGFICAELKGVQTLSF